MKKIIYLAYGSNMNLQQMKKRCPQGKLLGRTEILDYVLLFRGKKQRAVATIEKKIGGVVPALLWEIGEREEVALNHYEGYPFLYGKERISVLFQGKPVESMVYIMLEGEEENTPHPYYYNCIEESYKTEGFSLPLLENALKQSETALHQRETEGGIRLKTLDLAEMEQCLAIADQQLGAGYFTRADLSLVFQKQDQYFCDVAVDLMKNNQVIGFSYCKIIPVRDFAKDLHCQ